MLHINAAAAAELSQRWLQIISSTGSSGGEEHENDSVQAQLRVGVQDGQREYLTEFLQGWGTAMWEKDCRGAGAGAQKRNRQRCSCKERQCEGSGHGRWRSSAVAAAANDMTDGC